MCRNLIVAAMLAMWITGCRREQPEAEAAHAVPPLSPAELACSYGKLVVADEIVGSGVFICRIAPNRTVYPFFATARHVVEENAAAFLQGRTVELICSAAQGGHKLIKLEKRSPTPYFEMRYNSDLALIALPTKQELQNQGTAIQWVVSEYEDPAKGNAAGVRHALRLESSEQGRQRAEIGTETWMFGAMDKLRGVMDDVEHETPVALWRGSVAMVPRGKMKLRYGATSVLVLQSCVWEGDSGGPVFVRCGENGQSAWSLLGLLVGYVNNREYTNQVFKTSVHKSDLRVYENSGYAYLTPADVLVKMLEQLELDLMLGKVQHGGAYQENP
jgi:hypothetical protein